MKNYKVKVYEKPYTYEIKAENEAEAGSRAIDKHTSNEMDVYKVEVERS